MSPSPSKRTPSGLRARREALGNLQAQDAPDDRDEIEEDEETLSLQLQAIEAKLKLKRLRQAKSKHVTVGSDVENGGSRKAPRYRSPSKTMQQQFSGDEQPLRRARTQVDLQVPLSPPERKKAVPQARSPGRVLLGIDKGLKGRDVSLRRAPSLRNDGDKGIKNGSGTENSFQRTVPGTRLESRGLFDGVGRSKTFSERIAESRAGDRTQKEREDRIRQARSRTFDLSEIEQEGYKKAAEEANMDEDPFMAEARRGESKEYSRDEVLQSYNQPKRQFLKRSRTTPDLISGSQKKIGEVTASAKYAHARRSPEPDLQETQVSKTRHRAYSKPVDANDTKNSLANVSQLEPFSGFQLSKRILSHILLTRTFSGKKVFQIPDLLKVVKAPTYDLPDMEEDWVLVGIIASKSSPRDHKDDGKKSNTGRGKFMVLQLTDLKWELDLFLFSTAFDRFWKLTQGTVIAILNPSIMPPPPAKRDTGRFSLTLNSSDETVLEIGTARDLGFCKSVKKNGNICGQWVDISHTEFCAYHMDASLRKTKAGRMEVNTMTALFEPGGRSKTSLFGGRASRNASSTDDGLKRDGPFHDRATHSQIYVTASIPRFGRSSASLLDDEDVDPDAFHRGYSKEERLRRQLAEREREREIARQLGATGDGMGGAYLRANARSPSSKTDKHPQDGGAMMSSQDNIRTDTATLELLSSKRASSSVRLSPVKRKRGDDDTTTVATSSKAIGWSGAFKRGLLSTSPQKKTTTTGDRNGEGKEVEEEAEDDRARKKTRFITPKGIKVAGRESVGGVTILSDRGRRRHHNDDDLANDNDDDDDDDGLEIV